ncbi:MAG: hypothetical protein IJZ68_06685 [Bacteroidaceae bacterium]|nr:hypothetical protein [Bacteroidaceae bacterium]
MYEKIKTIMFDEIEVTIYKNMTGEYFAEYQDDYQRKKIPCGNDFQFIWEHLSAELGGAEAPTGWDLLGLADDIEKTRLTTSTTYGEICVSVENHLYEHEQLWPAYVYEELISILEYRYGRVAGSDTSYVKLSPLASAEEWFLDAITSKRIYRLETRDEYEDAAVRIIGAHAYGNDYLVEFEMLEFGCDDDDKTFWDTSEVFVKPMSECSLLHKKVDELPPEYDEVQE